MKGLLYLNPGDFPADADFVAGHNALSSLQSHYPHGQIITFFREPFVRLFSQWLFWRSLPPHDIARWGGWQDYIKVSHGSLRDYLLNPINAPQNDNIYVRMLLWPHPLIQANAFIEECHYSQLVEEALVKIGTLAHFDLVENPDFVANLSRWFGTEFTYPRLNELLELPVPLQIPFAQCVDAESLTAMRGKTAMDRLLWMHVARLKGLEPTVLSREARAVNLPRYARILQPDLIDVGDISGLLNLI